MPDNNQSNRPLPVPPVTPFGRTRHSPEEHAEQEELLVEKMTIALAEGRIEGFIKENLPDTEQARSLAMMMLGMSGMADMLHPVSPDHQPSILAKDPACPIANDDADILNAVGSGDIKKVKEMLKEEYLKRSGSSETPPKIEEDVSTPPVSPEERELLVELSRIASENKTTVDWLMMRALRLYIGEYIKTGRL